MLGVCLCPHWLRPLVSAAERHVLLTLVDLHVCQLVVLHNIHVQPFSLQETPVKFNARVHDMLYIQTTHRDAHTHAYTKGMLVDSNSDSNHYY